MRKALSMIYSQHCHKIKKLKDENNIKNSQNGTSEDVLFTDSLVDIDNIYVSIKHDNNAIGKRDGQYVSDVFHYLQFNI